jgi:hypothetical protein
MTHCYLHLLIINREVSMWPWREKLPIWTSSAHHRDLTYTAIKHGERGPAGIHVGWKIQIDSYILNWFLWLVKSCRERLWYSITLLDTSPASSERHCDGLFVAIRRSQKGESRKNPRQGSQVQSVYRAFSTGLRRAKKWKLTCSFIKKSQSREPTVATPTKSYTLNTLLVFVHGFRCCIAWGSQLCSVSIFVYFWMFSSSERLFLSERLFFGTPKVCS